MRKEGGWWVTDDMSGAGKIIKRAENLLRPIEHCRIRRTCIQAGGNIGVYPNILAQFFETVLTFEPERENFSCLVANTAEHSRVYPACGFLAGRPGSRELVRGKYSGGHQIGYSGTVPAYVIDHFCIPTLDAIFLDVEGAEYEVILGALETIRRCKPLLMLEENTKMHGFGHQYGDLLNLLKPFGYSFSFRSAEDIVLEAAR